MSWRVTIRYFAVPAIALLIAINLTDKIEGWLGLKGDINSSGTPQIGGEFTLQDQDKKIVNSKDFKDKFMLVYFGFTSCPHICPTDLMLMSNVIEELGRDAKKIQPIFITIDPKRDTPERMKTYLQNFNPKIIGLTGSKEQIADVINKYKIYAKKVEDKEVGEYLMDHSAFIYLMNKDGQYVTHYNSKQGVETIVSDIEEKL